jgi:hypothetical protein
MTSIGKYCVVTCRKVLYRRQLGRRFKDFLISSEGKEAFGDSPLPAFEDLQ